jgi:RNA polymerase sigma factor (sigma-70 family)
MRLYFWTMQSFSTALASAEFEHGAAARAAATNGPNRPVGWRSAVAVAPFDPQRDEENARWTAALTEPGAGRERAAESLYTYLLRAARSELGRRADTSRLSGAERDDLAHQAAADALVSIMRRIPDFRGDSMFTTWARSFVTFEVRVKIRQHTRRSLARGLTSEEWDRLPAPQGSTPEAEAEAVALKQAVMTAMDASLTERQRHVFVGVVVHGVSIEQLATQLGSNRNAVYQLMFHARRNLRRHLADRGFVNGLQSL